MATSKGNITVSPEKLRAAANRIKTLAEQYEGEYKKFYNTTENMSAGWEGDDNRAFIQRIDGFKDDFQKMKTLMDRYADFLNTSAATYDKTQDDIKRAANSLTN
ncbi:MAG: WXG100 family type VII secretion target [Clostridia bacterium]|nr:WXG100 family type VII secretion target [Clostridia bacterium]